jgi:hypothetical protein
LPLPFPSFTSLPLHSPPWAFHTEEEDKLTRHPSSARLPVLASNSSHDRRTRRRPKTLKRTTYAVIRDAN